MYDLDISFVILHYNAIKETINCIKSIKKNIDTEKYHIIVVDNCSPNKTGSQLYDKYKGAEKVSIILNDENYGFAKGNNIGISYARQINSKFICCLNNDTLLEDIHFFNNINLEYNKSKAALIGPKIIMKNNSTFVYYPFIYSQKYYKRILYLIEYDIDYYSLSFLDRLFKYNSLKIIINKIRFFTMKKIENFNKKKYNVVLHGCCVIFTPEFFTKLNGFNPKTFLYIEEELLYVDLKKNNLLSVYNPNIQIKHLEDVATNSIFKSDEEKSSFKKKFVIESMKILIQEMENLK